MEVFNFLNEAFSELRVKELTPNSHFFLKSLIKS